MLRLENVSKVYARRGREIVALRTDALEIPTGDYVAIVGPSGCGKTTLLSLLGGMLAPSSGRVWLGDASLYDLSVTQRTQLRRARIGFVFQTFNLVPYLTAAQNVMVPLFLAGATKADQQEQSASLLARVGLQDRMDHLPHELSIGQQQRVALARTLSNRPAVILADEPTGNLDPESRQTVLDFFDQLHTEGHTIVMVTHDAVAAGRASRKLALHEGGITEVASNVPRRAA